MERGTQTLLQQETYFVVLLQFAPLNALFQRAIARKRASLIVAGRRRRSVLNERSPHVCMYITHRDSCLHPRCEGPVKRWIVRWMRTMRTSFPSTRETATNATRFGRHFSFGRGALCSNRNNCNNNNSNERQRERDSFDRGAEREKTLAKRNRAFFGEKPGRRRRNEEVNASNV